MVKYNRVPGYSRIKLCFAFTVLPEWRQKPTSVSNNPKPQNTSEALAASTRE